MTRLFSAGGDSQPVTVVHIEPNQVVQIKTIDKDGYAALKIGYENIRAKLVSRPLQGLFAKAGLEPKRYLREIRLEQNATDVKVGDLLKVDIFKEGEKVDVSGISKGLGFQGAVRRHHFSGGPKTHGQSDRLRAPGSIGASSYPSRVYKGQRMAGRMGNRQVTVKNLSVVKVDIENNLLCLRGAVPGKINSFLKITGKK